MNSRLTEDLKITGEVIPQSKIILNPQALSFLTKIHRNFNETRKKLLKDRHERQAQIDKGQSLTFLKNTQGIRNDPSWKVAPTPKDLQKRYVEITGPVERKMMINAFNSGANIFMADFEDSLSPTWKNVIEGQANLIDAIKGTISFENPDGKKYTLDKDKDHAVLMVRPRGWHLDEKHVIIDGEPISASLFDFALFFFHNAKALIAKGTGPYFYLPKMQSHLEARLWNDVFNFAQDELGIPRGTIRATVLIETLWAAFEMEEILYELKDHSAGLNAGRWDYIFSTIKTYNKHQDVLFPDRIQITMTVPFMRSYTELLVQTCHKRGAHAMGGMAAFIPSRKDKEVNEVALKKVREDKLRESGDGFDGTWVAHPDLVPVAKEIFEKALNGKPNQKEKLREDVKATDKELLAFKVPGGKITEKGFRQNIDVAVQYMASWLNGIGAVGLYNLMEDAATAEISRAQLWQWLHRPDVKFDDGRQITLELYRGILKEEIEKIHQKFGEEEFKKGKFDQARKLIDKIVVNDKFTEFLTIEAYKELE